VLADYRHGSDKPDDSALRLMLLRTPGISLAGGSYSDQATQDVETTRDSLVIGVG
jgi:hypothetical protein